MGVIPPFLLKTDDNPEGVEQRVFDDIKSAIIADRYAYFDDFFDNFYNADVLAGPGSATKRGKTVSMSPPGHRPTPPTPASTPG